MNNSDFKYKRKTIEFSWLTGTLLSQNKYSETHVSSSGGGGTVTPHGGVVHAPTASSTVITNQDFWIKTDDGAEEPIQLRDCDIPLREGQRITVISAQTKKHHPSPVVLINHTAQKHWYIKEASEFNQQYSISSSLSYIITFILIVIGTTYIGYLISPGYSFVSFLLGISGGAALTYKMYFCKAKKAIQKHYYI